MSTPTVSTPVGRAPILPVIGLGIGAYLFWFGIHWFEGYKTSAAGTPEVIWPTDPVRAVLTGKPLTAETGKRTASGIAAAVNAGTSATAGGTSATGGNVHATGSAIADDALRYVGEGYIFGGPSQPGKWDCSSFVNYVVGHDEGMKIPGGTWAAACDNGKSHGPATPSWLLFGAPVNLGKEQPGDILVTMDHMGIVIGGGRMVSAQDPQLGVGTGGYTSGFPGGTPFVRRLT